MRNEKLTMNNEKLKNWIQENGSLSFARSGGPGGQHVNTSDTKVVLRIKIMELPLSDEAKLRIKLNLDNRINSEGELIIHASSTRSQVQNREKAEELAASLILAALKRKKKRRPTKPTKGSNERRIQSKKVHSRRKQQRREPMM
ncbi:MAG: alternative ribosome rescue aminoacyl-tRNA hydrolase ArfB [Spirochaetia bacterium]|nr:alternative ribosome rescue aminoacyl-tRNA hydrolase ArfB [Spirochaetia bacterium]